MTEDKKINIDYITIASTGDAQDFGDLSEMRAQAGAGSNSIRGIVFGGRYAPTQTIIDFVNIATLGNAVDFGDLTSACSAAGSNSNGHGGL